MVRVPLPQVGQQGGSSGVFTAPGVVPPADATGAQIEQLGQATQRAGVAISGVASQLEDRLHVAAAKEAQALGEEKILTANRGFLNTIGKGATGIGRETAWQDLQRELTAIEDGLEHEVERTLFRRVIGERMLQTREVWGRHEDKQVRIRDIGAREAVLQAKIEAYVEDSFHQEPDRPQEPQKAPQEPTARRNGANIGENIVSAWEAAAARARELQGGPQDPGQFHVERPTDRDPLLSIKTEARGLAEALHGPGATEETAAFVQQATTAAHADLVRRMVQAGRTTEARDYLARKKVKDETDADTEFKLQGLVQRSSVGDEGAQVANGLRDQIQGEHQKRLRDPGRTEVLPLAVPATTLLNRGLAGVQRMYEQGGITLEVAEAARADITRQAKERRAAEVESIDATARQGEQWMIEHPWDTVDSPSFPAALYQAGKQRDLLDDWRAFAANDRNYPTDQDLFSSLHTSDGAALLALPQREFETVMRRRLNPDRLRAAMALWREAHEQATPEDFSLLMPLRRVEDAAKRLGIDPKDDPEGFTRLRKEFEARANAWQYDNKEPISKKPQELDRIIGEIEDDRAFLPQRFAGIDFLDPDDPVPVTLMTEEQRREEAYLMVGGERVPLRMPTAATQMALEEIAKDNVLRAARGLPPHVVTKQLLLEMWVASPGYRK